MIQLLKKVNNICLFMLVFSVTFENWDPLSLKGSISVTYMMTVLYILSWIPFLKSILTIRFLNQFVVPLAFFIVVGIISTALNSFYASSLEDIIHKRMFQLIILMFLLASHLIKEPELIKKVLIIFILSIVMMYMLFMAGQGVSFENGRILIFGENPNLIGLKSTLAFLIALGFIFYREHSLVVKGLYAMTLLPFLNLTILSASRGALLSLFLGVLILVINLKMHLWKKLVLLAGGFMFSLGMFVYILETNPVFKYRILNTVERGDIGRNDLWIAAVEAIKNNLFMGVGIPGDKSIMFKYGGRFMDPHNVFLWVLLTTGVIGFLFFMIFIFRIGMELFKNYKSRQFSIYFIIYFMVILNMSKAGGGIGKILFWFLFGILIAGIYAMKEFTNQHNVDYENFSVHK